MEIAKRIDPQVGYLDAKYEAALFQYYFSLWSRFPVEMAQIYILKFKIAGTYMPLPRGLRSWLLPMIPIVVKRLPNGLWLLALLVLGTFGSAAWYWNRPSDMGFLALMMTLVGSLLMLESGIITTIFFLHYHQTLVFAIAVSCLLVLQIVLPALARGLGVRLPGAQIK